MRTGEDRDDKEAEDIPGRIGEENRGEVEEDSDRAVRGRGK